MATRTTNIAREKLGKPSSVKTLRRKVTIPDPLVDQVHRAELVVASITRKRVTVLNAPAGFGKTTLLAECCRSLVEDGVQTAWVSLDENDEPALLDNYIASSCRAAGLRIADRLPPGDAGGGAWIGATLVARAVEALDGPFVLALDEVDRPSDPASVALLEFLLNRGPPNLHLAMTCRRLPAGLNIGGILLQDQAEVLTEEELRFSKEEVAQAFNHSLTQRDLARIVVDSAGWPVAVRIYRNRRRNTTLNYARTLRDGVGSWMESRLFEGLATDEREFLLDIGLFEWMDAELLNEVLKDSGSMDRLRTLPALDGLLARVPGEATDRCGLHPLIREHCIKCRRREDLKRFNAVHRRIAVALMQRGETVMAMCHAMEAGEQALVGDILEHAGGVRMQIRQGIEQFTAANQLLDEDVISERPRLQLFRCLALTLSGHPVEAEKRYAVVAATLPRPGEGNEEHFELSVDDCVVRTDIALHGAASTGSNWVQSILPDVSRLVESPLLDPLTRGNLHYRLGIAHELAGQFDAALHHLALARPNVADDRRITIFIDLEIGQIAMARGGVAEAEEHYGRAHGAVQRSEVGDSVPMLAVLVLRRELGLECNRLAPVEVLARAPRKLLATPMSFSVFAAASGVAIDQMRRIKGVDSALEAADEMLEFALETGLPALVRYLSALRTSLLILAGRVREAERDWRLRELPEDSKGCLDLTGQSWREMEALSCAYLHVLAARADFDEGRSFARDLCAVAAERGLKRTLIRALSLRMTHEYRAGDPAAAARHLEEVLGHCSETPYVRPLMREHELDAPLVESLIDSVPDSPNKTTVLSLLESMRIHDEDRTPVLSEREQQILELLEGSQDKQIAITLGLTAHGVRYHMRKLFTKLGVHDRIEAVRRARELGLVHGHLRTDAD
jgi:LuxR family maltose regulon positive regulatory protein